MKFYVSNFKTQIKAWLRQGNSKESGLSQDIAMQLPQASGMHFFLYLRPCFLQISNSFFQLCFNYFFPLLFSSFIAVAVILIIIGVPRETFTRLHFKRIYFKISSINSCVVTTHLVSL